MKPALLAAVLFAVHAAAAPPQDAIDFLGGLTEALADADADTFLRGFDPEMKGYDELRRRVESMVGEAEVAATIEVRSDESKDGRVEMEADWSVSLRGRSAVESREARTATVRLVLERQGKRWRVTAFEPVSVFGPIRKEH